MPLLPLSWLLWLKSRLDRRMYLEKPQFIQMRGIFAPTDRILDLGGGGAGVIGQLYGRQVVAIDIRKQELDEAPAGPVKVVADARALPFEEAAFDAATAFYFFMYVPRCDHEDVFREALRTLKPGATFHIWDVTIPAVGNRPQQLFAVPVKVRLPDRTIQTAYGVAWKERVLSSGHLEELATSVGFECLTKEAHQASFHLCLRKPPGGASRGMVSVQMAAPPRETPSHPVGGQEGSGS
jgi:ubiquinone/menaquinone biosynthesis C-methylase UbiE